MSAYRGAMLGALLGDALGAPVEGHPGPIGPEGLGYLEHRRHFVYTDDTAMTIALAESLLRCGDLDEDDLAATFAEHHHREPHRGYGGGTASLLARVHAGEGWRHLAAAQFGGSGSFGNGAAMRSAPIALACSADPHRTAVVARRAARVTHTHPLAVDGAAIQATAVAFAVASDREHPLDPDELLGALAEVTDAPRLRSQLQLVAEHLTNSPGHAARAIGTGIGADEAVPAALWAALRSSGSFADTIFDAISLGGDTDTIASMAAAVTGAHLGDGAIPETWLQRVEGAERVTALADQFADRFPTPG